MKFTKDKQPLPLRLWYDKEAPKDNEGSPAATWQGGEDKGWERWSLPIGNGHFGVNVFGRTETERIQITEKTLQNPPTLVKDNVTYFVGGLNSFSETYIDFGHPKNEVIDYKRHLDLETAISGVEYTYNGVKYTREYFASYPDKALVIRLDANKEGALNFVLRPTIPYLQSYGGYEGDGVIKTGSVVSNVQNGIGHIELAGKMHYFDIDFLGLYRVYTDGGSVQATTTEHTYKDTDGSSKTNIDGTITVKDANSAYIVVTLGSDYELSSEIFTADNSTKPTYDTTLEDTRAKVSGYMRVIDEKISGKSYEEAYIALKNTHIEDHDALFGRVALNLGCNSADYEITTDKLLEKYKKGIKSTYLETLVFQYGRYLLIASSRAGALPANLQGAWNTYNVPPWACGYWHNINVQMNYWPAFSTNLAETFEAYVDYNAAYMEQAEHYADDVINQYNPWVYGKDGGNGWVIGFDGYQFRITSSRSAGDLGFTTQLFWEYYAYTKDREVLQSVYEILVNAARYITKCVELEENGSYLISYCDSPEMHVDGIWYYTKGTTYAQSFAYQNNYNALCAAKELGIDLENTSLLSKEEYSILKTIMEQIDKYDPIHVGLSGQIKEFQEEDFYCSIGDEYNHRHTSQLVGLYPGNIINSTTPAWLDAAKVTLTERGDSATGWGVAHKMNLWARTKNGNKAHTLFQTLVKEDMTTNLWGICPPFQIDANFGAAAGISEMLLQSHEGYIHPLAAIPETWSTGSYSGLVARGGFEVSIEWHDGVASGIEVLSKKGGEVRLFYPSIHKAKLQRMDGSPMNFAVIGENLISFNTEVNETYYISELTEVSILDEPKNLRADESSPFTFLVTWEEVAGAISYNVYVAEEDAAVYTQIGTCVGTSFTYKTDKEERLTFAVTAVNEEGVEGKRALCYVLPSRKTPYGVIPGKKAAMPFAFFIKQGEDYAYVDSFMSYQEAIRMVNDKVDTNPALTTAVIYLARNHRIDFEDVCIEEMPRVREFIFDLGKRTLEVETPLLDFSVKRDDTLSAGDVTMTGGTILSNAKPLFVLNTESKTLNLTLRDVRFARRNLPTGIAPLLVCKEDGDSKGSANITFDDCRLDFNTEPQQVVLFNADGATGSYQFNFVGGELLVKSLDKFVLLSKEECENISINFVEDIDGVQTTFRLTEVSSDELTLPKYIKAKKLVRIGQKKRHFTRITEYKLFHL